ncbi:MAG: FkbM family methyltransferase [Ruminococcaceae bacterium]|nr:FkbM family methyltransferase [Oscillospiraceae bacterium]
MNNFKKHIFNEFSCDLWHYLKTVSKPILIYGMGNGADKIIAVLESYGIKYEDVFASDGFVRGHSYRGKIVLSYSQAKEKYGDFIILLSFGTHLSDVMEKIYALDKLHELYAPDVPVCEGQLFCDEFFDFNSEKLEKARELLFDTRSKEVFDNVIRFKLTGRIKYLKASEDAEATVDAIVPYEKYRSYADLGAYNGDTIKKYRNLCPNLSLIYAFEPDFRNFKKLKAYTEGENIVINAFNYASWDEDTTLEFSASGNRNSSGSGTVSHQTKMVSVEARCPDSVIPSVDFIKYDVEGAEHKAIVGSTTLIKKFTPDLLVSMYHKSEDLFDLPLLLHSICPEYKLFLRRLPYIPAWDLNLYAIH